MIQKSKNMAKCKLHSTSKAEKCKDINFLLSFFASTSHKRIISLLIVIPIAIKMKCKQLWDLKKYSAAKQFDNLAL